MPADHATRFMLVRDGFSWRAFVFGPLWMLRHRMWLVLTLLYRAHRRRDARHDPHAAADRCQFVAVFLVAVLLGLEAATLRRWTLFSAATGATSASSRLPTMQDGRAAFLRSLVPRRARRRHPSAPRAPYRTTRSRR